MKSVIDFLTALHDNNNREWFNAHKSEYQLALARFNSFVEELIAGIRTFDDSIGALSVRDCTYRIYRDTRFSADKTPYKTYFSAFIAPHGKSSGYGGYYFHLSPQQGDNLLGGSFLITGVYMPESKVLQSIREEIEDNGAAIEAAIAASDGFTLSRMNSLKRTPRGFPTGTPYDEMLRLKDLCIERSIDSNYLLADNLTDRTVEAFRSTHRFLTMVNRAIRYAYEEMM
ncbi:MAG: DUF2461 domain-containing protein [Alistipes sp.]|nr:DUF2461 domain-containing protein [Alistipes sp.]MDE7128935.1 DUF2461 domain-containing protein [Alistipes sp.]